MEERIYYFSNLDNEVHNINDLDNYNRQNDEIEILDKYNFVIDTVILHTIEEVIDLLKNFNKDQTYWNGQGKYKKEYEQLEKFIPTSGWNEDNDVYINMLIAATNMYYRYYNDGDKEISERNAEKLNEGILKYKEDFSKHLENITHFQDEYYYIDNECMLEDIINAIIQIGVKEKLTITE